MNRKRTMKCLGLVLVGATLLFGGTYSLLAQDSPKKAAKQADKATKEAARAEKKAKLKSAITASKTSLSQAAATAEASTQGKAFDAEATLRKDGKLELEVTLFVGDKVMEVFVDPDTGKVTKTNEEKAATSEEDEGD